MLDAATGTRTRSATFYLNNILIHELGHLLDERNSTYIDRERYAEWFAVDYGYAAAAASSAAAQSYVHRRHHAK